MRRSLSPSVLLLSLGGLTTGTLACVLDPKVVGGNDPSTGTSGTGSSSESTSVDTTAATTEGDPFLEEAALSWDQLIPYAAAQGPDGDILALLTPPWDTPAGPWYISRFDESGEQWIHEFPWGFPEVLTVTQAGLIAVGGGLIQPNPYQIEARLWLLNADGSLEFERAIGPEYSWVMGIGSDGGMLWTTTEHRATGGGPPIHAELRRHAPNGEVVETLTFDNGNGELAETSQVAVGSDGHAYVASARVIDDLGQLHRIAPDGSVVWSTPLGLGSAWTGPSFRTKLLTGSGPGVLLVDDSDDAMVHRFTTDGSSEVSFPIAATDLCDDAKFASTTDVVVCVSGKDPETLVIKAWNHDGTEAWTMFRELSGASVVDVTGVVALPDDRLVVVGALNTSSPPDLQSIDGFMRMISIP